MRFWRIGCFPRAGRRALIACRCRCRGGHELHGAARLGLGVRPTSWCGDPCPLRDAGVLTPAREWGCSGNGVCEGHQGKGRRVSHRRGTCTQRQHARGRCEDSGGGQPSTSPGTPRPPEPGERLRRVLPEAPLQTPIRGSRRGLSAHAKRHVRPRDVMSGSPPCLLTSRPGVLPTAQAVLAGVSAG